MSSGLGVSVVIPAYNEEESIGGVVDEVFEGLKRAGVAHEVIVVDDGSTDSTHKVAREHGATVIRHEVNMGYGRALKTGVNNARFEYVAIVDADGSYPALEIPRLLSELVEGGFDMVLGERKGKQPLARLVAKFFISKLANFIAGRKLPDINTGLRVFKKEVFEELEGILPDGFSITATLTLACSVGGYKVGATPIQFRSRRSGRSKIRPVSSFAGFIMLLIRMALLFKPLKVFLPLALIQGLIGVIIGGYFIITMLNIPDSCLLLLLSAMQTALLGMLADILAFNRLQVVRGRRGPRGSLLILNN